MDPIQSFQIPVEIFIIFIEEERTLFCTMDIADRMNQRFKLGISKQSVQKTLKGLTETGRLIMETREKPGMKVKANYYRINPKIPELPYRNIIRAQHITRSIMQHLPVVQFEEPSKNGEVVKKDATTADEKE